MERKVLLNYCYLRIKSMKEELLYIEAVKAFLHKIHNYKLKILVLSIQKF